MQAGRTIVQTQNTRCTHTKAHLEWLGWVHYRNGSKHVLSHIQHCQVDSRKDCVEVEETKDHEYHDYQNTYRRQDRWFSLCPNIASNYSIWEFASLPCGLVLITEIQYDQYRYRYSTYEQAHVIKYVHSKTTRSSHVTVMWQCNSHLLAHTVDKL